MADHITPIIDKLSSSISDDVGNMHEDELELISSTFDTTLNDALKIFNSPTFDDDGFIKKMRGIDIDAKDKDVVKNVLNNVRGDYVDVQSLNHSELLMRRDLRNICTQMPEMRDVIYVVRDSIIECNVATGEVSRSLIFENNEDNEAMEAQAKDIETRHDLLMAIKNFIVPRTLEGGEMCIQVTPFSKLFAEIEAVRERKFSSGNISSGKAIKENKQEKESREADANKYINGKSLYTESNLGILMESASPITKVDISDTYKIDKNTPMTTISQTVESMTKSNMLTILQNISVCNESSVMMQEMGPEGFAKFIMQEAKTLSVSEKSKDTHFSEAMSLSTADNSSFGKLNLDEVNYKAYEKIKGCYVKYLDGLRVVPIRMDRRVIGYYYVSTTMDLQMNPAQPNGIIDLSFQHYTKDKNLVDNLANMIIKSFDKQMLEKNIQLKSEIAEIVMAHKFSEGRLSFIFIPENEIVRLVINEDENGRGHSIIEPTLFPARMYLMLTMYNMVYTLNNNMTRIHYLRSSGLNKDYAAQIQRTMRKFQSRRITIDDIYSFSGVLNKVGGMGEMVLPSGRGDHRALDTETLEAANNPISIEFLEQQRRQAISGTGVPHLLVINAIDEVDFAKTLEMANARFISTVSSYKIDFNRGLTKFYQLLMKYSTDLEDDVIQTFKFKFNAIKQQELVITAEMIANFNSMVDMVMSIYYKKSEMEDDKGIPTSKQMHLRRELAKDYLPQLDFDNLEDIIKRVDLAANDDTLQDKVSSLNINDAEINGVTEG